MKSRQQSLLMALPAVVTIHNGNGYGVHLRVPFQMFSVSAVCGRKHKADKENLHQYRAHL
jgi:hypothetical protein